MTANIKDLNIDRAFGASSPNVVQHPRPQRPIGACRKSHPFEQEIVPRVPPLRAARALVVGAAHGRESVERTSSA